MHVRYIFLVLVNCIWDNVLRVSCTKLTSKPIKVSTKNDENDYKNLNLLPKSCGSITVAPRSRITKRIAYGNKAALMEFPWMALLSVDGFEFYCAGTLINERYVLTAAHCVHDVDQEVVGVRIGEYDLDTKIDCDKTTEICSPPLQEFYAENIIVHPEYNRRMLENDIALLRLNSSVDFSYANARPICLTNGKDAEVNLEGKYAVVTGWGETEKNFRSAQLVKTQIPIVSSDHCLRNLGRHPFIENQQLCVGGFLGRGSCFGDSGGPLMVSTTGNNGSGLKFVQYGIISHGQGVCWNNTLPRVCTNVGNYVKWILDNMKS